MKRLTRLITGIIALAVFILPFVLINQAYRDAYEILKRNTELNFTLSTRIYDVNGELISELYDEHRDFVALKTISPYITQAFIVAEDKNFYYHDGIDPGGIFRAVLVDILYGEARQGGSTITQQLAKQLYAGTRKSFRRKIIELFITLELERRYTKDRIFELYLNKIYFGHGVYGIKSASRFFFNKEPADLDIVESAILAAIPSSPETYSPLKNPRNAIKKSRILLDALSMRGVIDRKIASDAFSSFWPAYMESIKTESPDITIRTTGIDRAPHFTEYVRTKLIRQFGRAALYGNGYSVYTTLDLKQQKAAEKSLAWKINEQNTTTLNYNRNAIKNIDALFIDQYMDGKNIPDKKRTPLINVSKKLRTDIIDECAILFLLFNGKTGICLEKQIAAYDTLVRSAQVEGALVAIDPREGAITAMVGGSEFNPGNQLNRAVYARRQPGSAFKGFIYTAAIDSEKVTAGSVFLDLPITFKDSKKTWMPKNFDKSFNGRVQVRNALAISLNVISVIIYDEIGGRTIARQAAMMTGVPMNRFTIDPSLALGTSELTPMEMAKGYAVLASGGYRVEPYSIQYITDSSGVQIFNHTALKSKNRARILSPETTFIMSSMLRDVVDRGTAYGAVRRYSDFSLPAAGKTGTTTEFRDAWFVGYTPDLVAAVWLGCDSPRYTLGNGQGGAEVAAPVWGRFMNKVYETRKTVRFPDKPANVRIITICHKTGNLPSPECPTINEYFIAGTEPKKVCSRDHQEVVSVDDLVRQRKIAKLQQQKDMQ